MRNIILICVSLTLTCPCIAKTIIVDDDGPADFNNIQAAINDANDGDTVLVKDGTYTGTGNHDIDFLGKAITVRSQHGPQNCIIDCNDPQYHDRLGFIFQTAEGLNSILDGFTIMNILVGYQGAINITSSSPTIKNCNITNNRSETGSGIYCHDSSPNITNCRITENDSCYGVVHCVGTSSPNITNCTITGNSGEGYFSGAIACEGYSSPNITNCDISGNLARGFTCLGGSPIIVDCNINGNEKGGIYCRGSSLVVKNSTIAYNENYGGYDSSGGGICCRDSSLEISDCNLTDNKTYYDGGAIYSQQSNLAVTHCNISGNSARDGGGIHCVETTAEIVDCNLTGNKTYYDGGAIDSEQSNLNVEHCNISSNSADGGGGGICSDGDSNSVIFSCLFSENTAGNGGAICNWEGLISNCTITGNSAGYSGGGIYCHGWPSQPTITNCTIAGNSAQRDGGGISEGSGIISNCIITANSAGYAGGGIYEWYGIVKNCLITANSARAGGGIYSALFVNSCTIVGNRALGGGGLEGFFAGSSVTNCIIWDNYAPEMPQLEPPENLFYNCIQDWTGGKPGNIADDPCFVVPGYWVDVNSTPADPNDDIWVDGDYHLLAGSPCIDTGDPNYVPEPNETDLDGNPRVLNGRIDMGAYESVPPVIVGLKLTPQMLSCESNGSWLKAHVTFPEEIFPEDIDVNTPAIADPPGVESEFIEVNEYSDGSFDVQIYFEREGFCEALSESEDGLLEVTVTGSLTDGRKFQGSDIIKLKTQILQHQHRQNKKLFEREET